MILSKVISADQLGNFETWQIPSVDSPGDLTLTKYSEGLASLCGQFPTLKEIENLQAKTYQESYDAGYQAGLQKAEAEFSSLTQSVHTLLGQLTAPKKEIDRQVKEQLIKLAITIARQIVQVEIKNDPEHIMKFIEQAIDIIPDSTMKIFVHLNPNDSIKIRQVLNERGESVQWSFIDDPNMLAGGCKVCCENSCVDLNLDTQLAKVASRFFDLDTDDDDSDIEELSI